MLGAMDYTILRKAAGSDAALFLYEPSEIAACTDLLNKELVSGAVHRPLDGVEYAVIYCATPDGRALLALSEATARILLKRREARDIKAELKLSQVLGE